MARTIKSLKADSPKKNQKAKTASNRKLATKNTTSKTAKKAPVKAKSASTKKVTSKKETTKRISLAKSASSKSTTSKKTTAKKEVKKIVSKKTATKKPATSKSDLSKYAGSKYAGSKSTVSKSTGSKSIGSKLPSTVSNTKKAGKKSSSIVKDTTQKKLNELNVASSKKKTESTKKEKIIMVKSSTGKSQARSNAEENKNTKNNTDIKVMKDATDLTNHMNGSTKANGAVSSVASSSVAVTSLSVTSLSVSGGLSSQITVESVGVNDAPEVPVKRKRGRPRKSESNGSSPQKLKETKGVRRFGMNYGRPGVAAGRYSWSAETGTSPSSDESSLNVETVLSTTSLSNDIEVEFSQGDKVVYPAHGLGIIDAIQVRSVGGSQQKFYNISIVETGMKIMVPVGQAKTVGLRRVVDPTTVDRVYDILRDKDIEIDNQTWNRRYREYSQKIKTGSVLEIASVIRDLTVLKIEKELSFNERRMLDTAQGLLVKELSIAKSSTEDSIKEELELICQP